MEVHAVDVLVPDAAHRTRTVDCGARALALALLEHESLSGNEIAEITRTARLAADLDAAAFTAG